MSIAQHVNQYLAAKKIPFELISHAPTDTTLESAISAHIPHSSMAKAVVMQDHEGHRLMAVLPANKKLKLRTLEQLIQRELHLLNEDEISALFQDCEPGAIPAIGPAYRMDTFYDDSLFEHDRICIEGGDHRHLISLSGMDFEKVLENCHHGDISEVPSDEPAIQY